MQFRELENNPACLDLSECRLKPTVGSGMACHSSTILPWARGLHESHAWLAPQDSSKRQRRCSSIAASCSIDSSWRRQLSWPDVIHNPGIHTWWLIISAVPTLRPHRISHRTPFWQTPKTQCRLSEIGRDTRLVKARFSDDAKCEIAK